MGHIIPKTMKIHALHCKVNVFLAGVSELSATPVNLSQVGNRGRMLSRTNGTTQHVHSKPPCQRKAWPPLYMWNECVFSSDLLATSSLADLNESVRPKAPSASTTHRRQCVHWQQACLLAESWAPSLNTIT